MHGANVQPGQVVLVTGELGQEEMARAVAAAAYDRGAKFVDVDYFDPWVKRARIQHADPETLTFVPDWYSKKFLAHAELEGARVTLAGVVSPNALDGLDMKLARSFRVREHQTVEVRWEVFNVTNTQRLGAIDASRTGFGITADPGGRPIGCTPGGGCVAQGGTGNGNPATAPTNWSNFTGIQGTPRVMQVGLRYSF